MFNFTKLQELIHCTDQSILCISPLPCLPWMCLSIYDEDRRLGDRERTGCWHSLDRPSIAIPQNQALVVLSVYTYEYGRLIYRLSHITMASTIDLAPCILCHSLSLSFCARTGPRSSKLRSGINWLDVWEESLLDGVEFWGMGKAQSTSSFFVAHIRFCYGIC